MNRRFYDEGCAPHNALRWPVVAARRLLRRLQRPFFFSLADSLERFERAAAQQQAAIDHLRAELQAVAADAAQTRALRTDLTILQQRVATLLENEGVHSLGLFQKLQAIDYANRLSSPHADGTPPRVLFAISSASQMYSGIGRAIFELVKRLRGRIHFEFAIDDGTARNRELVEEFGREHQVPVHVGAAVGVPDCMDTANAQLPDLIRAGRWDAIECVSWASSATNGMILEHAGGLPIVYTPHYQPMWTVPASEGTARRIRAVHGEMLRRAAVISCDSPWEWLMLQAEAAPGVDCALLPLGFDPAAFTPGAPERRPYLLFVGDQNEQRKRFPLTVQVFEQVLRRHPNCQLVVVGNKSDQLGAEIPEAVRRQCVLMGYVSEEELRTLYRESMGLLLFSDYEAFGLPIIEALASGTPVFLSRRPTTTSVFGRYKGIVFIDDDTPGRMAERVSAALDRGPELVREALGDRARVAAELGWDELARRRYAAIQAAVARRAEPSSLYRLAG